MAKRTPKFVQKDGLAGLFGHTYVPDLDAPDEKMIQYQFEIIRPVPPDCWLVQLFSFMDGRPTEVRVYAESFLLGDEVKLYLREDEWHYVHERECEFRRERRSAGSPRRAGRRHGRSEQKE
jgi:hypothetical protein